MRRQFATLPTGRPDDDHALRDGSRVAVLGGGPAGSLFAYFFLDMASRLHLHVDVDIYEPRTFDRPGPRGCNMCGGIVSETLVQNLAMDGVLLSDDVVQRAIDSYVLHTDSGSVRIATPSAEARIGAVHRGAGPRDADPGRWESLDHRLLTNAQSQGAAVIKTRIDGISRREGKPTLHARGHEARTYDLAVVATGVNTSILKAFEGLGVGYRRPRLTKTLIREYLVGEATIDASLGSSMHVFLLNLPRLEFAALIPKGDYVTMCLLGERIDAAVADAFANAPEVRRLMPAGWDPASYTCQCLPHINVHGVDKPYGDRVVFIGDSGVTRLYKDGIGAAYRTAKAAARTALFEGVSDRAFRTHFLPVCRSIRSDNRVGRYAFLLTRVAQKVRPVRTAILVVARDEQRGDGPRRLSGVLWDIFSGSAPYSDIFRRMVHPALIASGIRALPSALSRPSNRRRPHQAVASVTQDTLGRVYTDGEIVMRQGDPGGCVFVVQDGTVEIVLERDGKEVLLRIAGRNEILGEMAVFDGGPRSATVRAKGPARILTLDRRNFLRRINEDPSLAFSMIETMAGRVRDLSHEVGELQALVESQEQPGVTGAG